MPISRKRQHRETAGATAHPSAKRSKKDGLIERVNALDLEQFSDQYFPRKVAEAVQSSWGFRLCVSSWRGMAPALREACVDLVEMTSASHYRASEMGWSRAGKVKEMRHPAMKYVLVVPLEKGADELDGTEGFLSFMVTEEDGSEVIYCYELHLRPRSQGQGLGRRLMELMEMVGARLGVEKAMLTVFRSNERAVKVYGRWGYGVDEFSPGPRRFRDGTVKEPSYVIFSKKRQDFAQEEKR